MSDVGNAITGVQNEQLKSFTIKSTANQSQQQSNHQKSTIHYFNDTESSIAIATGAGTATGIGIGTGTASASVSGDRITPTLADICLSRTLKLLFSTPGLVVLVVLYSVMGAFMFPLLEAPQDSTKSAMIAKSREDCLRELWTITEKLNVLYERNWTMLVHEQLRRFEGTIVAATRNGGGAGMTTAIGSTAVGNGHGRSTALGRYGGLDALDHDARWSFSEALLYSVTVITTIGHGSLTPKTASSKIATIFYALIGVPLMLMCLSSLGTLLAEALQCTYARICCRLMTTTGATAAAHHHHGVMHSRSASGRGYGKRQQQQQQQQRRTRTNSLDNNDDGNMDGDKESSKQQQQKYHDDEGVADKENTEDCHGRGHVLTDWKSGKYDSIIGIKDPSTGYEYACKKEGNGEDSFQLLHNNSPGKVIRSPPCIQLKMLPANTQYYQRPTSHHMIMQQQQQQQQNFQYHPQPSPSPQHFQHPLQAFHIVSASASASANSSPTHQGILRPYATIQTHPHPHSLTHSQQHPQALAMPQQQPQHYVAVPSSMVRFQPSPNQCTALGMALSGGGEGGDSLISNANSRMPPNCYQPGTVAVTGAATIYFPLSTSSVATSVAPLVKYHTIQLQPKRQPNESGNSETHDVDDALLFKESTDDNGLGLPPPPLAYQTATVHGARRAKFTTNPITSDINGASSSDAPGRHDLLSTADVIVNAKTVTTPIPFALSLLSDATKTTTAAIATSGSASGLGSGSASAAIIKPSSTTSTGIFSIGNKTTTIDSTATTTQSNVNTSLPSGNSIAPGTVSTTSTMPMPPQPSAPSTTTIASSISGINNNRAFGASTTTVDIMEDEEEHEQQRMGNCPHGTPSRVPLIPAGNRCSNAVSIDYSAGPKDNDKSARNLINATAASFHRHTLHTFQRGGTNIGGANGGHNISGNAGGNTSTRKTFFGNSQHRRGCGRMVRSASGCFEAEYSADDDDESVGGGKYNMQECGNPEKVKMEQFRMDTTGVASTDDEADDNEGCCTTIDNVIDEPQVPISLVLLILICYIYIGTVIFALWENWSFIDSSYFCFVTLATIGFGDVLPERTFHGPEVQLFACCAYLLLGLILVAMSFSILETQLMWKCKRIAVRLKLAKD